MLVKVNFKVTEAELCQPFNHNCRFLIIQSAEAISLQR